MECCRERRFVGASGLVPIQENRTMLEKRIPPSHLG